MDTTKPPAFSCSPAELSTELSSRDAPLLIDVRKNEAFLASPYTLPGALRRDPLRVRDWADALPPGAPLVLSCVHGHEVSQNCMAALRARGLAARFLQGGIEAWREQGLPLRRKAPDRSTRWVTREQAKIDRIACPWLVRRFVDAEAEFLYVPREHVGAVAARETAMAFDVPVQVANTPFTHDGESCSFDAFLRDYQLVLDPALRRLALLVRGADTDRLDLDPCSAGLLAVSLGMARCHVDDQTLLAAMMPVYDALYAWCRDGLDGQDQNHNWAGV